MLHSERFLDQAPAQVAAALLDEDRYLWLTAVMRCVRDASDDDPRPQPGRIEEAGLALPPGFRLRPQRVQSLGGTRGISLDEIESALDLRKRGHTGPDAQHRPKPQVLTDALVHHLFVHAATTSVRGMRTNREVLIAKHAPDTEHLEALRFVRLDKESISHVQSPSGSANTKSVLPALGRSSGVRPTKPEAVAAEPVLTATYCRPSTA